MDSGGARAPGRQRPHHERGVPAQPHRAVPGRPGGGRRQQSPIVDHQINQQAGARRHLEAWVFQNSSHKIVLNNTIVRSRPCIVATFVRPPCVWSAIMSLLRLDSLLLIDEIEAYLHPRAQRRLIRDIAAVIADSIRSKLELMTISPPGPVVRKLPF